jgi:hypothetical protein
MNACSRCDGGQGSTVVMRRHVENQWHSIDCDALRTPDGVPRRRGGGPAPFAPQAGAESRESATARPQGSQRQEAVIEKPANRRPNPEDVKQAAY